jgi:peptidoglycan/LPS O-acetylase OafA/YrhL
LVLAAELLFSLAWQFGNETGNDCWTLWQEAVESGWGGTIFITAMSQIFLAGIDVLSILSWTAEGGWVLYASDLPPESVRGWKFLIMPHSWTLSCELFFYLLAPTLVRLTTVWLIVALVGFLLVVGWTLHVMDPSLSAVAAAYFAPFQLGFFLAGLLSFRLYRLFIDGGLPRPSRTLGRFVVVSLFSVILFHGWVANLSYLLSFWGLFVVAVVALPFLFEWGKGSRRDRIVGDLSYPLYLVHLMAIAAVEWFASAWVPDSGFVDSFSFPIICLAVSTLLAWFVAALVERPLDGYRQRRVGTNRSMVMAGNPPKEQEIG